MAAHLKKRILNISINRKTQQREKISLEHTLYMHNARVRFKIIKKAAMRHNNNNMAAREIEIRLTQIRRHYAFLPSLFTTRKKAEVR